ncbi:MAG: RdgB/HAM1 family non-canonical purine NTP pyrophosphatase [Clostridia bacterium]|nr:RdgB/HAM1 family non-canonical purine NTP pyrophosphatase [Clostridia bacterium]
MLEFVIATNNAHKLREMKAILDNEHRCLLSMKEAGIATDPEETGTTFEENALIKARAACAASGKPALADDSGIAVDALNGAPGIYSARYCEGSDWDRLCFLLKNMENVPEGQRGAHYVAAIACVLPDGTEFVVRGTVFGSLLREPIGEGGFGYDPIFFVDSEGATFAQIPAERKNAISHRANALKLLVQELEQRGL